MSPIWMTLIFAVTLGAFAWSAVRRMRLLTAAAPEPRFTYDGDSLVARTWQTVIYVLGQKKMPQGKYQAAGFAHMAIFGAFGVLLLNTLMLWARGYDVDFDFWGLLSTANPIGKVYSLVKELAAFGAIVGCGVFAYYRVVQKSKRMTLGVEGLVILGIITTMMIADYMYVGGRLVLTHRVTGEALGWAWYEPFGSLFALMFQGLESGTVTTLEHLGFWWHASFVLIFLNLLPHSKHFHVITAVFNVFAGPLEPPGKLPEVEDLEGRVERDEPVGVSRVEHLSWKHVLDLYTCTECGRCSDNCPAYTTGKKLSPKHLTLALRDHLYDLEDHFLGDDGIDAGDKGDASEASVHGAPPEGAYFRKFEPVELVGDVIHPEVLWACTTCRACETQCPVNISYVDKIVEMRRHEMLIKNEFPHELQTMFMGIEVNGNPWNLPAMDRGGWTKGLGFEVPLIEDKPGAEYIYWAGCAANYDDQAKKVARATARLLDHAGVDFAIMGTKATCTGDPARRAGNEYLFQILAEQNIEALNGYGADKKSEKTIVTACPHCFNTLGNEYPAFGGDYRVIHHTELLAELIDEGALVPEKKVKAKVAYHDSCYLGRYNEVYDAPRDVLASIPGVELVEPEYWTRERGLCCGAGGAQMWKEEEEGKERVNNKRTGQLLATGADTVASGCPFCMTMLSDGIKAAEKEDQVRQLDVAQVLESAIDFEAAE